MSARGRIERQAIGRSGSIGSLYNIRTDEFEPGSLFRSELPPSLIRTTDCVNVSYLLDFNNSLRETLDNSSIDANLQLRLMTGRLSVDGTAKYLNQTKTDSRTVRTTFIYKVQTKEEELLVSSDDLKDYFSLNAFRNSDVTHVVIGIKWGANVAATFERSVQNNGDVKRIESILAVNYERLCNANGAARVENDDQARRDMESLTISFSGDVMIQNCPQTIEQVFAVYREIPLLIQTLNDGKGKPMTFILCSIKQIAEITNFDLEITRLVHEVSGDIINRIEEISEEINEERRKLNDFFHDIKPWKDFIPVQWFSSIQKKLKDFHNDEIELKHNLSEFFIGIRSGTRKECEIKTLIGDFKKHPCSSTSINTFLGDNERIKMKREILERISPEKTESVTARIRSIENFIEGFYREEVCLLHICEQWEKEDEANSAEQRRFFINLKHNVKHANMKFRVIDYDLHTHLQNKPTNSVVYYAINGTITSQDFRKDSLQQQLVIPNLSSNQVWKQYGTTKVGGHGQGNGLDRLNHPSSLCIDDDLTIYVADTVNHRIVEWKNDVNDSRILVGGNNSLKRPRRVIVDKQNDSLIICDQDNRRVVRWSRRNGQPEETLIANIDCRDLMMDNDGYLCICNDKEHEVTRWKIGGTDGVTVAGGYGKGDRLDQLNCPEYIFIDREHSVYVSDRDNHRVVKWVKGAEEGIVVAGGQGQGDGLSQLSGPGGIIVDQLGNIYVADFSNHRIVRWLKGAGEGTIIVGGNGYGEQSNQFNGPVDLSFDRDNNLYVVDQWNDRIEKFDIHLY